MPADKSTTAKKKEDKPKTSAAKAKAQGVRERAAVARGRARKATTGQFSGFVTFIRTQGVVGLAVGLAIGTAAGDTVKKLVEGFINPFVQFIVGSQEGLQTATWQLNLWGRQADFAWGAFVSSAITLIATAFVIYLIIHNAKLDRLDKKEE